MGIADGKLRCTYWSEWSDGNGERYKLIVRATTLEDAKEQLDRLKSHWGWTPRKWWHWWRWSDRENWSLDWERTYDE